MIAAVPPIRLVTRSFGVGEASAVPLTVQLVGFSPVSSVTMEMVNDQAPGLDTTLNCILVLVPGAMTVAGSGVMIGWDEILEGGISPGATVMSWRGVKGGIEAAKMGHDVVMTPTTFAYLDYNQGERTVDPPIYASLRLKKCYSFEPVPEGVDAKHILGGQGNLWTEQVPTLRYAQYMTYPRAWALSEVYWSPKESKNWDNFIQRVENQFDRSDVAEVNYSKAIYDAGIKTSVKNGMLLLTMETEAPNLDIYYTIDDAMPDNFTAKYAQPVELPDGPITLRVITYRNGKPIGHLITLKREELGRRAGK